MAETPSIVNRFAIAVDGVIHTIFTVGFVAGREVIKTYFPLLRLPIISQLFDLVIQRYGDMLDQALQNTATYMIINVQTDNERKDFDQAAANLKQAQAGEDPDARKKAIEDFKKNLGNLVRWDGST